MSQETERFIDEMAESLKDSTFIKATLGNYKGADPHLQKILVRLIETKKGLRLFFLYRHDTRDIAKNHSFDEGLSEIGKLLGFDFFSAHLFTTKNDFQLDIGKKSSRLNVAKPTLKAAPPLEHDRQKKQQIDPHSIYLNALGITTTAGEIRSQHHDKWRQINKFVETLAKLVDNSRLRDKKELKIVDMGSGKGYLTFATYDYFKNVRDVDVLMIGVEARSDLAAISNDVARASDFDGLNFVNGTIDSFELGEVDILIALHACNTATDDAIYKGIKANAELIVAAPCCHQEIRPQIKSPEMFRDILKHGVMLERVAETLTDGLRSLLLEREGYATKLFEFISVEHTPKNNMLVGTKLEKPGDTTHFSDEIADIKNLYGIREHHLESLLTSRNSSTDEP